MTPLSVIITIAAYFAILFTVSYIAGRKADNAGFFVGNRKSSWYVVAFAMVGSAISGVTYVSVPGMVAASSFGYLQMVLGFIAGQLIIAYLLVPLFYKMNLVSIYEYLENRFGMSSYRTGAWFFFISKMLGAAVRLFLVCLTLQLLVFEPFGLPFLLNVAITVALVWLYTFQGGVKSLIWTDSLKTFCLVVSVVLCIWYIASDLNLSFTGMVSTIADSDMSRIFFFDDVNSKQYFLAVPRRCLHHDCHDRAGSGHDAAQPELQELQGLTEEHDYQCHFAVLRHPAFPDAGRAALHLCRQPADCGGEE